MLEAEKLAKCPLDIQWPHGVGLPGYRVTLQDALANWLMRVNFQHIDSANRQAMDMIKTVCTEYNS